MYDRKYEEKTQKSGLRVSKSCKKTRNSNRILMFTEKLNKRRRKIFFLNQTDEPASSCTQPKNELIIEHYNEANIIQLKKNTRGNVFLSFFSYLQKLGLIESI